MGWGVSHRVNTRKDRVALGGGKANRISSRGRRQPCSKEGFPDFTAYEHCYGGP